MNSIQTFPSQSNAQISQPRPNQPSSVRFGMSGQDSFSSTQANQPASGIWERIQGAASHVTQAILSFIGDAVKYVTSFFYSPSDDSKATASDDSETTAAHLQQSVETPAVEAPEEAIPVSGTNTESANVKANQTVTERLEQAIKGGSLEAVNAVLNALPTDSAERAKIINQPGLYGCTPLHWATYKDNLEMVKLLLANGANESTNSQDHDLMTPLHWAAVNSNLEMAKLLLANGANESINQKDFQGDTPIKCLMQTHKSKNKTDYYKMAGLLMAHGADPDLIPATPTANRFKGEVQNYLNTQYKLHCDTLANPEATPEQFEEASQWFQLFPPQGGALKWEMPTEQFKAFLTRKAEEFIQTDFLPENEQEEARNSILRRIHPVFQTDIPKLTDSLLLNALKQAADLHKEEQQH